ncbi:oxidase [Devosia limi DSM 17137]|uniref:Oxidase n=1 Tax=Devosia limi DSM 17137 TaxID=1121477 RepID=A0A0F5LAS5_9HYPH|nr:FAD-dependent oxidoreductase [Devosia limi]KKB79385.1 oxidase [Devosia limi DSM 17137]SHF31323.1 Pyruvate/2-oxoglutarate dehydrogenase complex, dihydrolipoamide dehydrogenase (E3) component [Devosia limi DSM 17137]
MFDRDVVVVGGGPAGIAAATALSQRGFDVELVDQRAQLGGAIYRQPIAGARPVKQSRFAARRWQHLHAAIQHAAVTYRFSSVFVGVDGHGNTLIEDRNQGRLVSVRARAVVIAVGAVEKVIPRPGWDLPGVVTAGGLQVMMKETGTAPQGRVLLAGNGPLLIAVAAQMAALGNAPVAIIESGNPMAINGNGLGLLPHAELLADALGYLSGIVRHRISWRRGTELIALDRAGSQLAAELRHADGRRETLLIDQVALHDGIRSNNFGLPADQAGTTTMPFITRAGDCREALGAIASQLDGMRAAADVAAYLSRKPNDAAASLDGIARQRAAQAVLATMFAPIAGPPRLTALPDETIVCRCERRRLQDLKLLLGGTGALSGREIKHNGRFTMGACQGRFCADNSARIACELNPGSPLVASDLTGSRWPVRPLPISALLGDEPAHHDQSARDQ